MNNRRGFTLVELLVVIGIIAVLISILLPALSRVQQQAQLIKCSSNVRQIITGITMYANDHKGVLPKRMRKGYGPKPSWYSPHLTYFPTDEDGRCNLGLLVNAPGPNPPGLTSPKPGYVTKQVLFCPSAKVENFKAENQLQEENTWPDVLPASIFGANPRTSYSYMPHWRWGDNAKTFQEARFARIADVKKDKTLVMDVFFEPDKLSHIDVKNKQAIWNLGFVDGHVTSVKSKIVYQKSFEWLTSGALSLSAWNDGPNMGIDDLINILETEAAGQTPYQKPDGASNFCVSPFLQRRVDHNKIPAGVN